MNRIVINADTGKHQISRHIYGHFSEHLGRCIYGGYWVGEGSPIPNLRGIRRDVVQALRQIRIPNLRWPGGCFADEYGSLRRGLLTSVFAVLIGMERIFHLDQMEDVGFAFLTGGRRCPSRHLVGGWRRHLTWYEVDRFCRRTSPWRWIRGKDALVSFDEHTIPRWTHKFSVPKGFITTRNKYMRCEKLYYGYDVVHDRYLSRRRAFRSGKSAATSTLRRWS